MSQIVNTFLHVLYRKDLIYVLYNYTFRLQPSHLKFLDKKEPINMTIKGTR